MTCPRRAATIPGAGGVRGNFSQAAASHSERTGEPNGEFTPAEVADADAGWICYIVALK